MLTPKNLKEFMQKNEINGEILTLEQPTTTVEEAAEAIHTSVKQIVKSVLFTINEEVVLAITCGTQPIERRIIATFFKVGRKKVKLADAETVLRVSGYPIGSMPPFGHLTPIRTLLDPSVLESEKVFAGGGAHNSLVKLKSEDLLHVSKADVVKLHTNL